MEEDEGRRKVGRSEEAKKVKKEKKVGFGGGGKRHNYVTHFTRGHRRMKTDGLNSGCPLYTFDAADDTLRVDFGGRRFFKINNLLLLILY